MNKNSTLENQKLGIIFALTTTVIFGVLGIVDKQGTLSAKNPFIYSTQSIFFAFCFTFLCYFIMNRKSPYKNFTSLTSTSWIQIIVIGIFASGLFILLRFIGLTQSTGTFATLSQAVTTSLTVILAHFFLQERLSKKTWLYFILILVAMYFVSIGNIHSPSIKQGDFYILFGTIFLAISNVTSRQSVKLVHPIVISVGRFFFGFIFLFIISLLFYFHSLTLMVSYYSLASGVLWAANVIFFNMALQRIGASLTTSLIMIAPIITMLLEAILLSYHFTLLQYFAAFVVVCSGIAITFARR